MKILIPIIIVAILVIGIVGVSFYFNGENELNGEDGKKIVVQEMTQASPPAGSYCLALGYEYDYHQTGGSYCIFPDKTRCIQWEFYRGKCGQEWSYCKLKGYDLKNLTDDEGWSWDGSVCIDKNTKEEIGKVYNLVNEEWANQNK